MSFLAYPSYRQTEVEWLGEVPSHWTPTRLRFLVHLNPSKSELADLDPETEVSFLPMEAVGERGELSLDQARPIHEVLTGYTYFREADVTIAKITPCFENGKGAIMRDLSGGVGFGTTELIVARARSDATTPEFLDWLFRSPAFRTRGEAAMYGAGGQKRVPDNFVRDFVSPGAPLVEQVAIAAFLNREIAKIDALIEEQRRLIALLNEKRQAVISHAVTKGLDPHAPMKDSGIEWLGGVPAHWQVLPLRRVVRQFVDYRGATPNKVSEGVPLITATQIKNGRIDHSLDPVFISEEEYANRMTRGFPALGDLLLTTEAPLGEVALIDEERVAPGQRIILMKVAEHLMMSGYLHAHFRSDFGQSELWTRSSGSTASGIRADRLRASAVLVPPLAEQREIVNHIEHQTRALDGLFAAVNAGSDLLRERRAALISAAVTGKIDVRQPAKVLPFPIDRARARGLIAAEIIERSAHQPTFGRVKFQKIAFLAEGHVGIRELAGTYTREAAGPLDRALIDEMESGARTIAGVTVDQAGGTGTTVTYTLGQQRGAHRAELADWLGSDRTAKLDKLIADFAPLTTKQAEAVATLYGVWNDALIDGASPSDDDIISGFLNDWHPEKREKFRASELPEWLGWMRRHGIVPTGSGPKTMTGRLFA